MMVRIDKKIIYFGVLSVIIILSVLSGLSLRQIVSLAVFASLIAGTLLYWNLRLPFGLIGVSMLLMLGLLDISTLIAFAHIDIIIFLIAMMTIIGYLEEAHFFEYITIRIIRIVGTNANRLVAILMALSAVFSALVDEVTAILFMAAMTWEIARLYNTDPLNLILGITFTTIIGGSATVVGDPVAIIVAFEGNLTMTDFLRWATPITILATIYIIWIMLKLFKENIQDLQEGMKEVKLEEVSELRYQIEPNQLRKLWFIFLGTVGGIVIHKQIADLLGYIYNAYISPETILLAIPLIFSGIALLFEKDHAHDIIVHKVDWWTLTFFMAFFASVGTLKLVGITNLIAGYIFNLAGGNDNIIFLLVTIIVGLLSPVMDNVLAVATFSPVVHSIAEVGINIFPLWWGLLFGGVFMALLTPVGATASIVVMGLLERRKIGTIAMRQWVKVGVITAVPSFIMAVAILYLRFYIIGL